MGLSLGAAFMIFGLGDLAADHARARQFGDAAIHGYAGAPAPEGADNGLATRFTFYGVTFGADADTPAPRGAARVSAAKATRAELECLTTAVYYEARGESARGQAAVAQVVLNRVKHPAFPKSVCAVVYQGAGRKGCQFSFACDGSMRKRREPLAWERARDVATRALTGAIRADVGQATHFHTTAVSPIWAPQMLRVANVGAHVFYKFAPYRLRRAPAAPSALDRAVMTAAAGVQAPELTLAANVEQAIEASLQPSAAAIAERAPAQVEPRDAKPAEAKSKDPVSKDAKVKPPVPAAAPAVPAAGTEEARLTSPQSLGSGAS